MKKIISLLLVSILILSNSSTVFAAMKDSDIRDQNFEKVISKVLRKFEKQLRKSSDLSDEEITQLLTIYEKTERELLIGLNEHTELIENYSPYLKTTTYTGIPTNIPETTAGRTEYFSSANEAKAYSTDNAYAGYELSNPETKLQCVDDLTDSNTEAWAWTGNRFRYVGSLNTTATITLNDLDILGTIEISGSGSSGQYITDYRIFDATLGEYVYNENLYYDVITNTSSHPNNSLVINHNHTSESASITLEPNHSYVVFTMLRGYGTSYLGTAYINILQPVGATWSSMGLDVDFY